MLRSVIHIVEIGVVVVAATVAPISAQPVDAVTGVLKRAGIFEQIGERSDLDARFVDEAGRSVLFGEYFDGEHSLTTTTLQEGDDVTFDDDTLIFTNNDDSQSVILSVNGIDQTILPGESFVVNNPPTCYKTSAQSPENLVH